MIVRKVYSKVRICIDFSNLNREILRKYFLFIDDIIVEIVGVILFFKFDVILGFWQICLDVYDSKLCIFNLFEGRKSFISFIFVFYQYEMFINEKF